MDENLIPIPSLRDPSRAMLVRVVPRTSDPDFSEFWGHVRSLDCPEAAALFGVHPELDRLLSDPVDASSALVDQEDGIHLYQAASEVPGWPVESPDFRAPLEFSDQPSLDRSWRM